MASRDDWSTPTPTPSAGESAASSSSLRVRTWLAQFGLAAAGFLVSVFLVRWADGREMKSFTTYLLVWSPAWVAVTMAGWMRAKAKRQRT